MRRIGSLLLLLAFASACTQWQPAALEPANLWKESRVRVFGAAGQRIELRSPTLSGDRLRDRSGTAIPVAQIRQVQVRRVDGVATGMTVALALVAVVAVSVVAVSVEGIEFTF